MGNPRHFSLELPQRCLQLIEELWPCAETIRPEFKPELGALTTTFLISMSMPIINLPVERIERYKDAKDQGYADDRHLNAGMARAIADVLGGHKFKKAPFFISDAWSFATRDAESLFNIADLIPDDLAIELGTERAIDRAAQMPTSQWCSVLRNALAHGGIAYLDDAGASSFNKPVKMYAFISGKFDDDEDTLIGLNILRISESNYRAFLKKWVRWLRAAELTELMPLELEPEDLLFALRLISSQRAPRAVPTD
jgi:hypothetical protein